MPPAGHDHGPGGITPRPGHDPLPVPRRGDLDDCIRRDLDPERPGLALQTLGQLRPADRLEAGVILDPGGIDQLAAREALLHDHRLQARPAAVEPRRQPGRP